jgi:hypothetical protein
MPVYALLMTSESSIRTILLNSPLNQVKRLQPKETTAILLNQNFLCDQNPGVNITRLKESVCPDYPSKCRMIYRKHRFERYYRVGGAMGSLPARLLSFFSGDVKVIQ